MTQAAEKVNASKVLKTDRSFFPPKEQSGPLFFQPKLSIGPVDDVYEREADSMADQVLRMTDKEEMQQPFFRPSISSLQRKCAHCEEEEKVMQRKEVNGKEATANNELESYVGRLDSGGQALPDNVRNFYEPRFGYDFSQVKVHTDTVAAKSAQSINALAYTSGNHIVFNQNQYNENSEHGKKLLGHELTHVVQQGSKKSAFMPPGIQRQRPTLAEDQPMICRNLLVDAKGIETNAALQTLRLSGRVAAGFLRNVGALSARGRFIPTIIDNKYWFAKLYELITYHEIAEQDRFRYPAFVMHFIPIFYEMYYVALQHYFNREFDQIHERWLIHFQSTERSRSTSATGWMDEIQRGIETGVSAHIRGDMATALEQAFRSYRDKYCLQNASLQMYHHDFFDTNRAIFDIVKASFFIELARFSPSPFSIEMTQFLFGAGEQITGAGLSVDEIYSWRERAWQTALSNLRASP